MRFDQKKFAIDLVKRRSVASKHVTIQTITGPVRLLVPSGLRGAAKAAKVSAPTLSRIERGGKPDIDTFAKLCGWMNENPTKYFKP